MFPNLYLCQNQNTSKLLHFTEWGLLKMLVCVYTLMLQVYHFTIFSLIISVSYCMMGNRQPVCLLTHDEALILRNGSDRFHKTTVKLHGPFYLGVVSCNFKDQISRLLCNSIQVERSIAVFIELILFVMCQSFFATFVYYASI